MLPEPACFWLSLAADYTKERLTQHYYSMLSKQNKLKLKGDKCYVHYNRLRTKTKQVAKQPSRINGTFRTTRIRDLAKVIRFGYSFLKLKWTIKYCIIQICHDTKMKIKFWWHQIKHGPKHQSKFHINKQQYTSENKLSGTGNQTRASWVRARYPKH